MSEAIAAGAEAALVGEWRPKKLTMPIPATTLPMSWVAAREGDASPCFSAAGAAAAAVTVGGSAGCAEIDGVRRRSTRSTEGRAWEDVGRGSAGYAAVVLCWQRVEGRVFVVGRVRVPCYVTRTLTCLVLDARFSACCHSSTRSHAREAIPKIIRTTNHKSKTLHHTKCIGTLKDMPRKGEAARAASCCRARI